MVEERYTDLYLNADVLERELGTSLCTNKNRMFPKWYEELYNQGVDYNSLKKGLKLCYDERFLCKCDENYIANVPCNDCKTIIEHRVFVRKCCNVTMKKWFLEDL